MDRGTFLSISLFIIFLLCPLSAVWATDKGKMVDIVDADTLRVEIGDKVHTVLLIGVDSPTSRMGTPLLRRARNLHINPELLLKMGKEAKKYVMKLIPPGSTVELEYDWIKLDQQGRTIAYVYIPHDGMLNEILLEEGYARARLVFPFSFRPKKEEIITLFQFLERKARRAKKGLWRYGEF